MCTNVRNRHIITSETDMDATAPMYNVISHLQRNTTMLWWTAGTACIKCFPWSIDDLYVQHFYKNIIRLTLHLQSMPLNWIGNRLSNLTYINYLKSDQAWHWLTNSFFFLPLTNCLGPTQLGHFSFSVCSS